MPARLSARPPVGPPACWPARLLASLPGGPLGCWPARLLVRLLDRPPAGPPACWPVCLVAHSAACPSAYWPARLLASLPDGPPACQTLFSDRMVTFMTSSSFRRTSRVWISLEMSARYQTNHPTDRTIPRFQSLTNACTKINIDFHKHLSAGVSLVSDSLFLMHAVVQ